MARDRQSLLEFVQRDWAGASLAKDHYWRDWKRRHGPAAGIQMADYPGLVHEVHGPRPQRQPASTQGRDAR